MYGEEFVVVVVSKRAWFHDICVLVLFFVALYGSRDAARRSTVPVLFPL